MLYDTVLNVMWLQDANYAKTSGYDTDGLLTWSQAKTWASSLTISRFSGESLTGWRLASNTPVNGTKWSYDYSTDGATDVGYNIKSTSSELAYMYYVNLGLKGFISASGAFQQADFGVFGNGTAGGQADVDLVKNLQSHGYWSGTAYEPDSANFAWGFHASYGYQGRRYQFSNLAAWAVRPGDVAAVPEPEVYAMWLVGVGLLAGVAKRRRHFGAS